MTTTTSAREEQIRTAVAEGLVAGLEALDVIDPTAGAHVLTVPFLDALAGLGFAVVAVKELEALFELAGPAFEATIAAVRELAPILAEVASLDDVDDEVLDDVIGGPRQ